MTAPTCPISHNGPLQSSQPGWAKSPTLPPVHNLREVINAVSRINNVVQQVTRGAPQINNIGQPPVPPGPPPGYGRYTWEEVSRTYTTQKVINPDDPDQAVEVKRLSSVTWLETTTGHQLTYEGP